MQALSNVTVNYRFSSVYQGKLEMTPDWSQYHLQHFPSTVGYFLISLLKNRLKIETLTILCAVAVCG